MYNSNSYGDAKSHPPKIGYGVDGFPLFGRYLSSTSPGYDIALDECGGHDHGDSLGYHYHSQVLDIDSSKGMYRGAIAGPRKCWRGDVSKIDNFWDNGQAAYGSGRIGESNLNQRSDYPQLLPCCDSKEFILAEGVALSSTVWDGKVPLRLGTGAIVGIAIGGAVLLIIIVVFVVKFGCRKNGDDKAAVQKKTTELV